MKKNAIDVSALEAIYREHIGLLINYGLKITDDVDLVKDCIQDLFIEIWKKRSDLADIDQPKFYLLRALRNNLLKDLSRNSFVSVSELQLSSGALLAEYVELEIISKEQQAQISSSLKQQLQKLPKRQQEVIYLRFYQNFSYESIASIMNMNYQSVLNLMQRSIRSLRKGWKPKSSGSNMI